MWFQNVRFIPRVMSSSPRLFTWDEPHSMGDLENFVFTDDTGDWIPSQDLQGDILDFTRFPPPRSPPPGWHETMEEIRNSMPPREEDPGVVYRPG